MILLVMGIYFVFFQNNLLNTKGTNVGGVTVSHQNVSLSVNSSSCQPVIIGTSGSGSTGGSCSGYSVIIGTYGTYTNYGNACPLHVTIGTYGIYFNNVTGCNPQVIIGTGAVYYNVNTGKLPPVSSSVPTTTTIYYASTIPYTTISSSGSGSCSNFELTESSANSSTSGSCTWAGGYLTVIENEGIFQGINVSIIGGSEGSSTQIYIPVYDYPSCEVIQHSEYLSAGTYEIYLTTGSAGLSCSNSYAYVQFSP